MKRPASYNPARMTVPPTITAAEVSPAGTTTQAAVAQAAGKERAVRAPVSPSAIGLLAILVVAVSIGGTAYGGYRAGVQQRAMAAATAVAKEVQLQFRLAAQDMQIGQSGVAAQRLEYVVRMNPDFPGAAQMLAKAREAANGATLHVARSTEAPLPVEERLSPEHLFNLLAGAYQRGEWPQVVQRAAALKATGAQHRSTSVDGMLFVGLRNRGIERIDAGVLEMGLTDLEHAEQIMDLDNVALQRRRWAALYLSGMTFWELNWQLAIDNLSVLYQIAPNFRDARSQLRKAHIAYGEALLQAEDSCLGGEQFAAALLIETDERTEQQLAAAEKACAQLAPGGAIAAP
jgi:hypothetical protein